MKIPPPALCALLISFAPALGLAQTFEEDPATRFGYLLQSGETFTQILAGDFNDDGRVDLAGVTSNDRAVIMSAASERQHHRVIDLPTDNGSLAALSLAVLPLASGPDQLLIETSEGLWVGEVDEEGNFGGTLIPGTDPWIAERILFDDQGTGTTAVAWRVGPNGAWLQPIGFYRATGAHWLTGLVYPTLSSTGPMVLVDLQGNGFAEIAVPLPGGVAVVDVLGQVVLAELRAGGSAAPAGDRLARLRDQDGTETLAWIDAHQSDEVVLLQIGFGVVGSLKTDILPDGHMFAADLDGDGLADLVFASDSLFGPSQELQLVAFPAQGDDPRYDVEDAFDIAVEHPADVALDGGGQPLETIVSFVVVDLDRDGDQDIAALTQTRLLVARDQTNGHRELLAEVEPGTETYESNASINTSGQTVANIHLLEPAGWSSIQSSVASLKWRVHHRPDEAEVEVISVPVASGTFSGPLNWPIALNALTLTPGTVEDHIWYLEYELVKTDGKLLPSGLIVIAPESQTQLETLMGEGAVGGRLWGGEAEPPDGGTFGALGVGPKIPRLPPPRPVTPPAGGGN